MKDFGAEFIELDHDAHLKDRSVETRKGLIVHFPV